MRFILLTGIFLLSFSSISSQRIVLDKKVQSTQFIAAVLDKFHLAAAQANAQDYFSLLSEEAVFLGTDATERWTKKEFNAFVQPYFTEGRGWSYAVKKRNISIIQHGQTAFFDEILYNEKYGHCRGAGVLIKTATGWKIAQYNLSVMLPNEIVTEVVGQIKRFENKGKEQQGTNR